MSQLKLTFEGPVKMQLENLQMLGTSSTEANQENSVVKHSLFMGNVSEQEENGIVTANEGTENVVAPDPGAEIFLVDNPIDLSQQNATSLSVQKENGKEIEDKLQNEIAKLQKEVEEKNEQIKFMEEHGMARASNNLPYSPEELTALLRAIVFVVKERNRFLGFELIAIQMRSLQFWGGESLSVKIKYEEYMKQVNMNCTTARYRSPSSLKAKWRNIMYGLGIHGFDVFVSEFCNVKDSNDQQMLISLAKVCILKNVQRQPPMLSPLTFPKQAALNWIPDYRD